jgi:hypothetical protein
MDEAEETQNAARLAWSSTQRAGALFVDRRSWLSRRDVEERSRGAKAKSDIVAKREKIERKRSSGGDVRKTQRDRGW